VRRTVGNRSAAVRGLEIEVTQAMLAGFGMAGGAMLRRERVRTASPEVPKFTHGSRQNEHARSLSFAAKAKPGVPVARRRTIPGVT